MGCSGMLGQYFRKRRILAESLLSSSVGFSVQTILIILLIFGVTYVSQPNLKTLSISKEFMGVTGCLVLPPASPPCLQFWLARSLSSSRCPRLHLRLPLHCIQAGRPLPPSKARHHAAADIRSCTQGPTYSQVHCRIHPLLIFFSETTHPAPLFSHSHPSASSLFSASPGCSVSCCSRTSNLVPSDHSWAR